MQANAARLGATSPRSAAPKSAPQSGVGTQDRKAFPIVGLGASAGGLGALEAFFEHVPAHCGLTFVVVTHLHPKSVSLMPELHLA